MGYYRVLCSQHDGLGSGEGGLVGDAGDCASDVHDISASVRSVEGGPCLGLQNYGSCPVREHVLGVVPVSRVRTGMVGEAVAGRSACWFALLCQPEDQLGHVPSD